MAKIIETDQATPARAVRNTTIPAPGSLVRDAEKGRRRITEEIELLRAWAVANDVPWEPAHAKPDRQSDG